MAYNVKERVSLYEYGSSAKKNENGEPYIRNVVGAFMIDVMRPKEAKLLELIGFPTEAMIIEFLYGRFSKMGLLIIEDLAFKLVQLCEEEHWEVAINILQDIVDGKYE